MRIKLYKESHWLVVCVLTAIIAFGATIVYVEQARSAPASYEECRDMAKQLGFTQAAYARLKMTADYLENPYNSAAFKEKEGEVRKIAQDARALYLPNLENNMMQIFANMQDISCIMEEGAEGDVFKGMRTRKSIYVSIEDYW